MALGDYGGAFGPFNSAFDPAMGRILAKNPEALIPFFAMQGISPPKDPARLASLGGSAFPQGIGGGQPPLESGYPPPPDVPPISPSEQPPTSEPLSPSYKPPGPGEPGYVMQPPVRAETPPVAAPAPAPQTGQASPDQLPYGHVGRPGDPEWVTDPLGFARRKYEEYSSGGEVGGEAAPMPVGEPPGTTTTGSAAAAAAPPAAPGAVAAPAMPSGTPFNTYGELGGLYPLAVPGGGPTSEGAAGVPLPPNDPRRAGIAGPTGASGKSSAQAVSDLSKALAGIKAPPAPAQPQVRPHSERGGQVSQSNPLAAFLAQYLSGQGGQAPSAALRLYQTLGGR